MAQKTPLSAEEKETSLKKASKTSAKTNQPKKEKSSEKIGATNKANKQKVEALIAEKKAQDKFDKIIEIRNITKVFDGVTVVDDVNFSIKRGEFVTLLGPSGCGKTTLLRMIAGFEMPTVGTILLDKQDLTVIPPHKRPLNTVFQKYALFPHLNVYNNIAFGLKLKEIPNGYKTNKKTGEEVLDKKTGEKISLFRKLTKEEIDAKVHRALKLVNLEGYEKRDVNSLSGGQQQRIAIARAIVCEPKVLLLDEPLGALDLKMRKEMQIELMSMHKNLGITFIYVTHDQEEALTMSDKVIIINDGTIQQIGTPQKVYDEPANVFVANFIGESNILSGTMLADYKVNFCSQVFECMDKGFAKNEKVDIVIRPEDIKLYKAGSDKGTLKGTLNSSVFKGTNFEMIVDTGEYEFTVHSTVGYKVGDEVEIKLTPESIHIMKKLRTVNEFISTVTSENTIDICGADFEFVNTQDFEKGDRVKVSIAFDKITLTDDEDDGTIGGNIGQTYYKGAYYQVQVYTDDDSDFYLDTEEEWDLDDRVGILIDKDSILVEKYIEEDEEEKTEVLVEGIDEN